jgi:hypothetical protein
VHAEPCWKRSCDGNQAWIKIARDRDMTGVKKLVQIQ